ncbi:MAG: BadF/BadG/BcrA/BcrD ATPase family protein [Candidatus Sulfotelmatobacter sp.]
MAYYLGIDGGGSKTTCAVGDETSLLALVVAGPSNITRVGEARARESLHRAIGQACAEAKIDARQLSRACVGAAGAGRERIASVVRSMVAELIPGNVEVVGDMEIALQAALGTGPGVIVIAGTCSIAYGRDAQRKTARAGGWGFAISDEGSAQWIGRAAVGGVLRAVDEPTCHREAEAAPQLFHEIKSVWKIESVEELARAANSTSDFAVLFPAVLAAADYGDELARQVLAQAARELARLARIVLVRLSPERPEPGAAVPLAMAGGVFRHSPVIRELFYNDVRAAHPQVVLKSEVVEPVHGALQLARRAAS